MRNNNHQNGPEERRRCKACGQLRPLREFPLRNRRRIHVCGPCRMLKRFTKQEKDRKEHIKRKLLAVGREVRRGRAHYRSTRELLEELRDLCGSWGAVADEWAKLVEESARKRPGGLRAINQLRAMVAIIREASNAAGRQRDPPAVPFDPTADVN